MIWFKETFFNGYSENFTHAPQLPAFPHICKTRSTYNEGVGSKLIFSKKFTTFIVYLDWVLPNLQCSVYSADVFGYINTSSGRMINLLDLICQGHQENHLSSMQHPGSDLNARIVGKLQHQVFQKIFHVEL